MGPKSFRWPYLARYSEIKRSRRIYGSAAISRSAIEAKSAARVAPVVSNVRCPSWHPPLSPGMFSLVILVPILIVIGLGLGSVRLLSHRFRRFRWRWGFWRRWGVRRPTRDF